MSRVVTKTERVLINVPILGICQRAGKSTRTDVESNEPQGISHNCQIPFDRMTVRINLCSIKDYNDWHFKSTGLFKGGCAVCLIALSCRLRRLCLTKKDYVRNKMKRNSFKHAMGCCLCCYCCSCWHLSTRQQNNENSFKKVSGRRFVKETLFRSGWLTIIQGGDILLMKNNANVLHLKLRLTCIKGFFIDSWCNRIFRPEPICRPTRNFIRLHTLLASSRGKG